MFKIRRRRYHSRERYRFHHNETRHHQSKCNEIPGFYYDSESKRYFKLGSDPSTQNQLKPIIAKEKKPNIRTEGITGKESLVGLLSKQQLNLVTSNSFRDRYLRLSLSNMKCVSRINIGDPEYRLSNTNYVIGEPKCSALAVSCTIERGGGSLIQSYSVDSDAGNRTHLTEKGSCNIHELGKLTDLCIVDIEPDVYAVLYAVVPIRAKGKSMLSLRPFSGFSGPPTEMCGTYTFEQSCEVNYILWSCAWNQFTKCYAAGGEKQLFTSSLEHGFSNIKFKENCFSLAYNTSGNLLFIGTNEGYLKSVDTRSLNYALSCKLGRGVSYLKMPLNENVIIASAYDGKLMQVDLRAQKSVLEYPDHVNNHMKLPFSIDEEANILCSVGQDHITRLWSLKEGKLLKSVSPECCNSTTSNCCQPMSWFSNSWQMSRHMRKSCLVMSVEKELRVYDNYDE